MSTQGERGRTGDTGQTGEAGAAGDVGAQGEAGVPGRQGEAGVSGRQGEAGHAGLAGGQGERGRTGRAMSGRQALAGFLVVLTAFTVLAFRSERNASRIAQNTRTQCVEVATVARQINAIADALVRAETRRAAGDTRLPAELAALKTPVLGC